MRCVYIHTIRSPSNSHHASLPCLARTMPHGRRPQLPRNSFGLALWSPKKSENPFIHCLSLINITNVPIISWPFWDKSPFSDHFRHAHIPEKHDKMPLVATPLNFHLHPFEIVSEGVGKAVGRQSLGMSLSTRPYVLTSWIAHLAGTGSCHRQKKQTSAIPKAASVPWFSHKNSAEKHGFIAQNIMCSCMFPLNPIQWQCWTLLVGTHVAPMKPAETSEPFVADLIDLAFAARFILVLHVWYLYG